VEYQGEGKDLNLEDAGDDVGECDSLQKSEWEVGLMTGEDYWGLWGGGGVRGNQNSLDLDINSYELSIA
jgi:hypothetical protein